MKKIIFGLNVILIIIDQLLKHLVTNNMSLYESIDVIPNFLSITYVENDCGAFSIFSGNTWFFIIVSLFALIFIIRTIIIDNNMSRIDVLIYTLILSGLIGNLIDRIFYGKVIDYIDFKIFSYNAPIFNFADICIVFGAFILIYNLVLKDGNNESIYSGK